MNDDSGSGPSGPRNVLLQTGDHSDCDESACMDLLGVEDSADVDVLFVTFTKTARERLEALKRHAATPPANVGVVSVEVGGSNGGDRVGGAGGPTVRRISDPSDLTGVGIAISELLAAWSGDGNRTVVCFESLTALLQYVDASRVFQFCNEITSKFERAGARAHFHLTPGAHERQELSVLSSLFDGRVSTADLGHGPDAGRTAAPGAADTAREVEDDSVAADVEEAADAAEGAEAAEATDASGADPVEDDPFEYAVADTVDASEGGQGADDGGDTDEADGATDDGEPSVPSDDHDGEDTGGDEAPPDADPADLVSSVIAGEPEAAPAGPSLDADIPDPEEPRHDATDDATDDARPEATSRQAEREELRRRLEYIGPDAATPTRSTDDADADDAGADDDGTADRPDKYTFYQRTTATVVGVVVMLVLISFLSAAMPVPIGTDAPDGGDDLTPTATAGEVAVADATGGNGTTATPTREPTATPTATATPTPTPDSSTGTSTSSSTSGSTDDGSSTEETATATPTETATPEPTPTQTETPSDDDGGLISDTLDSDDDELL
jgi:hypothetical protein